MVWAHSGRNSGGPRRVNYNAVRFAQRAVDEMIGKRGGEALGCLHSLDDPTGCGFGPSCGACKVRKTVLRTFRTGASHYQVEFTLPFASREEPVNLLVSTALVHLREGRRVLVCIEDVTERTKAEEEVSKYRHHLEELVEERTRELRDAQEELVRKERLAFLGQMAGGVAHELRNPLGAIKNVAYYLKLVLKEPEPKVAESLDRMDRAASRADGIVSSLLDFAAQRPLTLLGGNVNDAVREALTQVEVPENVEVVTRLDDTLPQIPLDPGQLGQVFENLIVNAVQAMVDGGRLTVKSECSGAGWVAISIADTGVGLSPEDLAKVFQPLFTTRASGIGLGLTISQTIVEAHGGSIEAQSEPGAGSTFTVRLPVGSEGE